MVPRPSFGSFYKFVVSVGLVLLTLAIAAPLFLLREPFDFLVSTTELEQLTEVAQEAIRERQQYGLDLARALPIISGILGALGLVITGWGLRQWWIRQKVQDEMEDTSLQRERLEIRNLTEEEVQDKHAMEAEQVLSDSDSGLPAQSQFEVSERRRFVERMAAIESQIAAAFSELADYRTEVQIELESGPHRARVDFLLLSARFEAPDLLVEVKYSASTKSLRNRLRELTSGLERARMLYQGSSGRTARGVGLVVVPIEMMDQRVYEMLEMARSESILLRQRVNVALIPESYLEQMSTRDWSSVLSGESILPDST